MIGGFLHRPRLQRAEFSFCCKRHGPPCFSCLPDRACSHRDWVCAEQKPSNTFSYHSSGWLCLTDSRIWFSCSDELGWLCREFKQNQDWHLLSLLQWNWMKIKRRREHERFSVCFQLGRTATTLKALKSATLIYWRSTLMHRLSSRPCAQMKQYWSFSEDRGITGENPSLLFCCSVL